MREPFIVRHYSESENPTIKGNGFDGLVVGEDREEAEAFIAYVNNVWRELAAYKQALSECWPDGYLSDRAKVHPSLFPLRVSELLAANA